MTNSEILKKLSASVCTVDFIKADGSPRTLKCTRNANIIGETADTKNIGDDILEQQLQENPNHSIPVFVTDIQQWRSFKPESVLSIAVS